MPGGKMAAKITPKFRLDLIDRKALGGKAIRKQVTISFPGVKDSPKLHLLLYVPAKALGPCAGDSGSELQREPDRGCRSGNRSAGDLGVPIRRHPRVPVSGSRRAETRAVQRRRNGRWKRSSGRGYALATIYCGDIEPDFAGGMQYGVRQMFLKAQADNGRARRMGRDRSVGLGTEPRARLSAERFGRQWAEGRGVRLLASGQSRGVGRRRGISASPW